MKKQKLQIGRGMVELIQEICEVFLVTEFHQAVLAQLHAGRNTLMAKDMVFVRTSRYRREGFYVCPNEKEGLVPSVTLALETLENS